jgi:hypothetical protein
MVKARTVSRKLLSRVVAQVKRGYQRLKSRYGPRYTRALVGAAFVALLSPIPGSVVFAVALVVAIAEVHRAISRRGGRRQTSAKEFVMSINCDVILHWSATEEQLRALGAGLWRWCNRRAGDTGIYQYLDNQPMADLLAGKFPVSSRAERTGVHFKFRDEASQDRLATIDSLRREIPAKALADILVDGRSWTLIA